MRLQCLRNGRWESYNVYKNHNFMASRLPRLLVNEPEPPPMARCLQFLTDDDDDHDVDVGFKPWDDDQNQKISNIINRRRTDDDREHDGWSEGYFRNEMFKVGLGALEKTKKQQLTHQEQEEEEEEEDGKSVIIGRNKNGDTTTTKTKLCARGHWRPAEDAKLKELVAHYGPQNWNLIAENLHGRSGKSCRLRWFNQLDPRINRKAFNEEEEERLLTAHRLYGNKWAMIARLFPGRTDNGVKNHWHVIMARKHRQHSNLYRRRKLHHLPPPPPSSPLPMAESDLTFQKNFSTESSTISSTVDDQSPASTCTQLSLTPSNNPLPPPPPAARHVVVDPFFNPSLQLLPIHFNIGSSSGSGGEKESAVGKLEYGKKIMGMVMVAADKSGNNSSDSYSVTESSSSSSSNNRSTQNGDGNEKTKPHFIDFLGVNVGGVGIRGS